MTVFTREQMRNWNFNSKCAFWIKIWKTVCWTVCTPNYIAMHHLKCAFQMTVRRCFPVTQIMQRNHCMNALTSKLWFGGGAKWPSNHFRLYTACCICTEAQEMRAPCMSDWQGTQTFFSHSGMLNPKFGLSCVHCVIQISQMYISRVYTA